MDFEQFLRAAKEFDPTDRDGFGQMVFEGRCLTGQSLRQVATELRTAPGTVSRWEAGVCAPPVVARTEIVRRFASQVRRIHARRPVAAAVA
jgi:hypothetical protein